MIFEDFKKKNFFSSRKKKIWMFRHSSKKVSDKSESLNEFSIDHQFNTSDSSGMILFLDFAVGNREISSVNFEETFLIEINNLKLVFISSLKTFGKIKVENLLMKLNISFLEFLDAVLIDRQITNIIVRMIIEIGFSHLFGIKSSS